jgi:hypothetical protein
MIRSGQPGRRTRPWALLALALALLGLAALGLGDDGSTAPLSPEVRDPASRTDQTPHTAREIAVAIPGSAPSSSAPATEDRTEAPQGLQDGPPGRLLFRVLTPEGEPATRRLFGRGSWLDHAVSLEADGTGRCTIDLADRGDDEPAPRTRLPAPGSRATLTVTQAAETGSRRAPGDATLGPSVVASFAWPEAGRDLDLGVLLLEHAPVLVDGRLLGAHGIAVPTNGRVRWSVQEVDGAGAITREMTEGDAFYAVLGEDGSFALRGPPAGGPGLRLSLRDDVQQTFEPVTTGSGRRGFDVTLVPTSRIQARMQVRGPVRPDHIRVTVEDGEDPDATWPARVRTVWRAMPAWTSLSVVDIKPGRHHVVFSHEGVELLRLQNVSFPAGRASEDARLVGLELVTR